MTSGASHSPDPSPDPAAVTRDHLADLQAGLLDDATAARVRRQVRDDPAAARTLAGLDAVRRDLAQLGADTAPPVPADVTARVAAALQDAPRPAARRAHAMTPPTLSRMQWTGLLLGVIAVGVGVVLGAAALTRDAEPAFPAGPTASQITVAAPTQRAFPLTVDDVRAALATPADLGPLADPRRRASCLAGLGHPPAADVLGGRPLDVFGRPGILLLLPGPAPEQLAAVAVDPSCSAANSGLLAETVVDRR